MNENIVILDRLSEECVTCFLNRPEKRNALSIELMRQLCAHIKSIEADKRIRVLVLRGNGPVFSAGLDLREAMDPIRRADSANMIGQTLSALYRSSVVTIAMVHGLAMGGGAGLVAACDFAVADENTRIGFPEVRRGLVAAQVLSLLIRKLRPADIRYLLLSGEAVDARRARQMGLFHRTGDMETESRKIVAEVLRSAPGALEETKRLLDRLHCRSLEEDIEMCMSHLLQAWEKKEAQEGVRAFLEKRNPEWDTR